MKPLIDRSIALIIPDFDFGGEEKRVVFFANNYLNFFKDVYVFSPNGKSSLLLDPRVKHIKISIRNHFNIFKILLIVKKQGIFFMQGHKRASLPILIATEKLLGIQCNFNFDNIYFNNGLSKFLMPKTIFYLSDVLKEYYESQFIGHSNLVINMGGDFFETLTSSMIQKYRKDFGIEGKIVLLSLGRLSTQKNHRLLIEALKKISTTDYIVLCAGEGPCEEELKKLCIKNNLQKNFLFLGHRTDINLLLNVSDFLVQSSIFEGFPNVFIEAASVGLPIIATNVGSSKTLVKENGILVASNDIENLANAIDLMIKNLDSFKQNAVLLKSSDYFVQFHKNNMLSNYLAFYKSYKE